MEKSAHIFISYSHKDTETMQKIKQKLHNAGLDTWADENITVGTPIWQNAIAQAIETASSLLVLLSPNAKSSEWVQREINYSTTHNKPIIAMMIEGTEATSIPFSLIGSQYVDVRENLDAGMAKILPILKTYANLPSIISNVKQSRTVYTGGIRVLVVDDHHMVRSGLIVNLEAFDDIGVIGEAGDGETAVDMCRHSCPDVVLMDMIMPRMNGIIATGLIRKICPSTQVIAFTSFAEEEAVQDILKAGAIAYLLKNASGDELANAIRLAYEGKSTLAPEVAQILIKATTRPPKLGHDITEREREVLALMIEGLNNREIGERLVISSSTVKNHVSNILFKLDTTSRTQAVAIAVEHRLVE